jgi:hypothetical protein
MRRLLLAALLAFLLAGCIRTVGPDYEFTPDSSRSVIIVSLTASGRIPGELLFYIRPVGDKLSLQGRSIQVFGPTLGIVDWPILKGGNPPDQPPGRLAVLEIAPGDYEFFRWSGVVGGFVNQNAVPFSKRFEVRAGEVVYLGNLHLARRGDQQWSVTTADRRDRDFPLLEKKLPKVPPERVAIRLLK